MVNPRQQHLQKTKQEKSDYWDNVIRRPGPTLEDTKPIIDSTDQPTAIKKAPEGPITPTKLPSRTAQFIKEEFIKIIMGIIVIVLLGFMSWGAATIYSFNREIGVINNRVENLENAKENTQQFQNFSDDLDRLEQRLDNHIDRHQMPAKK